MKKDYPLYVISNGITEADRAIFNKIYSCTGAEYGLRFVDVDFEDVDVAHKNAIIAVGSKALKAVIQEVKKSKIYDITRIVGKDFVDPNGKFFMYVIPYSFNEMMIQENKQYIWEKVEVIYDRYKSMFLDDTVSVESEDDKNEEEDNTTTTVVEFDSKEVLDELLKAINLNDPGLLKSFNKYEKMILNTSSGVLNVLPTNRTGDLHDEMTITIKDLVVLLKLNEILDVSTFTFEKKDGISVSVD